jgi:hypothetical protein
VRLKKLIYIGCTVYRCVTELIWLKVRQKENGAVFDQALATLKMEASGN